MQHVHAIHRPPLLSARLAGQLDAQHGEDGLVCGLVAHPDQARVEVDLGRERRDAEQARVADNQQRGDRLVEEARIDVGCLLLPAAGVSGKLESKKRKTKRHTKMMSSPPEPFVVCTCKQGCVSICARSTTPDALKYGKVTRSYLHA